VWLVGPFQETSNRVTRQFGAHRFLRVSFELHKGAEKLHQEVLQVLPLLLLLPRVVSFLLTASSFASSAASCLVGGTMSFSATQQVSYGQANAISLLLRVRA